MSSIPDFMFATGIENSYPVITGRTGENLRRDEMESRGFYKRWREDFQHALDPGIKHLRYGPPCYRTHTEPGSYDWEFTDETSGALREMRIEPIADLCHFGLPDWAEGFQNPDWPKLFADYAAAFCDRFPWVKLYTPVNEIRACASQSARHGNWNKRKKCDKAFVTPQPRDHLAIGLTEQEEEVR